MNSITYDNGTLELLDAASALLGGLLRNTLLMLAAVQHSPGNLAGVLALEEQGLGLRVEEEVSLACRQCQIQMRIETNEPSTLVTRRPWPGWILYPLKLHSSSLQQVSNRNFSKTCKNTCKRVT
jgi:hypothetical protein